MRLILIIFFYFSLPICVKAQVDPTPTNSFSEFYRQKYPSIQYQYDTVNQIHNYSNNWDFDKDGVSDQVYFVGTSGAHLYYYLRVILSSDSIKQDFSFLETSFPVLPAAYDIHKAGNKPNKNQTYFTIYKVGPEENPVIFINLDEATFSAAKHVLKRKGIRTNLVTVSFKKRKAVFKDFSGY